MKFLSRLILPLLFAVITIHYVQAQENPFTKKYKESVVTNLSKMLNDNYVLPEVAKKTEAHLMKQLEAGHFKQFENDEAFAEALTESVQSITKDKHLRIWKNKPYEAPDNSPERVIEEKLDRYETSRRRNSGFHAAKILEGNVGYLDLRSFAPFFLAKDMVDSYMKLLSNSDAVIVDLSKNGGGDPNMVQYLCSYFFDKKVHLNSLYFRRGDRTDEFWTVDVDGTKMPDVPLFVITSNKTFSGAEEFSYNMQTQKRATLIGQTTGGGANPGGTMPINDNLSVFVPGGMAINPITKTNWEGVGVIPEIKTTPEGSFDKAHELAKQAADEYRLRVKSEMTTLLQDLNKQFESYTKGVSEKKIYAKLRNCTDNKLLEEWEINVLGYDHLFQYKKPKIAESIFRANTILFPNSANVFDSYAECLLNNGENQAAVDNYIKAVEVAKENEDPNLELFKENLQKAKDTLPDE